MKIDQVIAKPILDTRGRQTIETTLRTGTFMATASVPSGKSTGEYEAIEIDANRAVENVNGEINSALAGHDFNSLDELDAFLIELDGTPNKSRLGANAILSVSIAAMRLSALLGNIPLWEAISVRTSGEKFLRVCQVQRSETLSKTFLASERQSPRLFINMMEGGAHADFRLPFQEYLLVVEGKTSSALPIAQEIFAKIGEQLGAGVPFGDEGGYSPTFDTTEKPFELLASFVAKYPNTSIAIDSAASELLHDGNYELLGKKYTPEELLRFYENLVAHFPIRSIEDPFAENAKSDFTRITATLGEKILIIGDDLTVTDPARIKDAADKKEINAVLIKPNQIGTVREALEAAKETRAAGFQAIASHRSGETNDTFIADFAYGIGAYGLKAGGFGQRERLVKYERLLAIDGEAEAV